MDRKSLRAYLICHWLLFFFICTSASALSIKVIRPEPSESLTLSSGYTFVIGTVDPPDSKLICNGVECEVSEDGAFIGFAPICPLKEWISYQDKLCDAQFDFLMSHDSESDHVVVPVYTPLSPSAAVVAEQVFDSPKVIQLLKDQLIGLEGSQLGEVVFVPAKSILTPESGDLHHFRCKTSFGTEILIPVSDTCLFEIKNEQKSETPTALRPWKISIPDSKIISFSCEDTTIPSFQGEQPFWGLRLEMLDGKPHFLARQQIQTDDKKIDPEHPLKNLRVCLDPGHHPDRGAVGPRGFEERESCLLLARETAKFLEIEGAQVSFTREENPLPIKQRHERIRELTPDLVISIHNNSVGDGYDPRLKHGTQTFYLYPWSKPLADCVHQSILHQMNTRDLGCIQRNLYMARFTDCPAILIEPEYLILPDEEKNFLNPIYRQKLAKAIADGIRDFVNTRTLNSK